MNDIRFRMKVKRLHEQGPRPLFQFLEELGIERMARHAIDAKLDRYLAIPNEALDVAGGRDMAPILLHGVRR